MKRAERNEIYEKLIQDSDVMQIIVCIEEMAGLTKELTKTLRDEGNIEKVIEEMANVKIMLEQMELLYGIEPHTIRSEVDKKLNRTKKRFIDGNNTSEVA